MIVSVRINNQTYRIYANEPVDISIPFDFAGAQPNAFNAERATAIRGAAEIAIQNFLERRARKFCNRRRDFAQRYDYGK
ncbi:MAG TPA: hypothetical protein VNI84_11430 [Pyrinomonadaceae bacterium]|nr:hypothetical protein [Pyrinomonadaceae bacterium]